MAGPAGAHGGGHPDHGIGGPSGISGHSAGTGAESASGGSALGPDAPAFGGTDPSGGSSGEAEYGGIAAFRSAIAKALGVQDLSGGVGTIGGPQAQPGSPALEAHDMDTDAVREALDKSGMFDDGMDMTGPASQADVDIGMDMTGPASQADYDIGHVPKGARGYEVVTETENMALPYNQMDEQERKAFWGNLNRTRQAIRDRQTPLGKSLHTAFSFALGMSKVSNIGKAIKAALDKFGFNVNPNEVEQAARHAFEVSTQGPEGAGGTPVGSRNDSFIKNFFDNLPASSYDEPWMKGLNERQIQYYLDRPSELEWVRNLYNQMNPMSPVFVTPTN